MIQQFWEILSTTKVRTISDGDLQGRPLRMN